MILRTILRLRGAAFILLLLSAGCARGVSREAAVPDSAESIQWLRYFEALGTEAKPQERILMLYFASSPCGPCEMMRKWTFADERVRRRMEDFVPVQVRGDIELQAVRRFGVQSFPTIVFFDPKEGEIDRKAGFRDADFLLDWIDEVRANRTTMAALRIRLKQDPDDLEALVEQAHNLVEADRMEQALELARRAQALAPENADVLALIGLCRLREGAFEEAEAAIAAALELDERNEKAHSLKIAILLNRADMELVYDNAAAAMERFSAVLEFSPGNFDALMGTGRALIRLDRGPEAVEIFRQAAEVRSRSSLPHDAIGSYYLETGDEEAAEKELLEAIRIEPRQEAPYFRLIEMYEKQGRRVEMMEMYERALPLSPAGAHNEIAWLMATTEHPHILDPEAAIKHAGIAIELEPRPWYIDTLAEAYYAAGRYEIAIAIIKEAIAKEPDDLSYYEDQLRKFREAKDGASLQGKEGG